MCRDATGRCRCSMRKLVTLDLAAQGTALVSAVTGEILIGSVVLMSAASHHVATIAIRVVEGGPDQPSTFKNGTATLSNAQLILWMGCVLLAMFATALGAHGLFHAKPLNALAMAGFTVPGVVAATTTAVLAFRTNQACDKAGRVDAFLSAVPTTTAMCVSFVGLGTKAGRLDALAGLALILLLCARALIYVRRTQD